MKKCYTSNVLLILGENHWKRLECHTVLAKKMKKCDTPSVLTDFMWKSLKTLGVSHFLPKKHETVWHSKRFLRTLGEHNWKRLECHTFLAKNHKKVWHSKRFDWFQVKIIENAWCDTLFLLKNMIKSNTPSVFTDFRWKSLFYISETPLFPTPAFPADPLDPPDPVDPGEMVPELALRPSLPRAPGVRMTWV